MSDLDEFVLKYKVDSKEAEKRIEALEKAFEGVKKKGKGATEEVHKLGGSLKEFGSGAAEEIGKVIPGIDGMKSAVMALGAEFAVAAVAVAVLAAGIKAVMDTNEMFQRQRKVGQEIGVSGVRVEEMSRQLVHASPGRVDRPMVEEGLKKFGEKYRAAFSDISGMGLERRQLHKMGVHVGTHTTAMDALTKFAEKLNKMPIEKARGYGKAMGFDADFIEALAKRGAAVAKQIELTDEEIKKRQEAEVAARIFNDEIGKLKEKFTELEVAIGSKLLPVLTEFLDWVVKFSKVVTDTTEKIAGSKEFQGGTKGAAEGAKIGGAPGAVVGGLVGSALGTFKPGGSFGDNKASRWLQDKLPSIFQDEKASVGAYLSKGQKPSEAAPNPKNMSQEQRRDAYMKEIQARDKQAKNLLDGEDKNVQEQLKAQSEFERAMNMFVGAVASFANAIDEQQAIAAWAGEVGKAAGLNNEPEKQVNGESPRGEVAQPAPSAYLPNGPEGEEKGTPTVVEKFLHAPPGPSRGVSGESRENIQLRSTQATFAQNLGIPLEQVQQGAVSKGDIAFESRQLMAKIRNNIIQLQRSLASQPLLPAAQKSKIINEIQVQQRGLRIFEQQKGKVLDKAREGGRSITVGERAIVVNVNGAGDPMKTGMAVKSAIVGNAKEIANSFNDGISH